MKFSSNTLFWIIAALFFGAAMFFTVQVELFKRGLNVSSKDIRIEPGQKVTVVKIIDGDEISVKAGESQFIVRILGIMSYEPSVNDPITENAARDALRYLQNTLLNNEAELVFDKFQKDSSSRVLSYISRNGRDTGRDMVAGGYSVVYTRYPFSRMEEYLKEERGAIRGKKGLWAVPAAAERSRQLKKVWERERNAEGAR